MYNALVFSVLPRSYEGLCKSNIRNLLFSKESPTSRLSSTLATIQIFGFPYTGSYTLRLASVMWRGIFKVHSCRSRSGCSVPSLLPFPGFSASSADGPLGITPCTGFCVDALGRVWRAAGPRDSSADLFEQLLDGFPVVTAPLSPAAGNGSIQSL